MVVFGELRKEVVDGKKNPVGSIFHPPKRQYLYISGICKWDIYCQLGDNMPSTTFLREPKTTIDIKEFPNMQKPERTERTPGTPHQELMKQIPITL